ncbi:S-adenosyl-L-methionine-dependent methyltransferase [Aspergillus ellipticus CBS 707.79]|uniref:S-adenosyl-L-methionine-dependent methyltransferase n=1 Tax=Aspergillus ellipticus CBS 707.79 TaxID=1448320 RepID=A0A319DIX6_9EURO|nr:S-adenosyl-L-methionine-dependent methyltransferase [Aspergillus ellipticus CBS 707.79]
MGSLSDQDKDIDNVILGVSQLADGLPGGNQMSPCQQARLLEACDKLSSRLKNPEQGVAKLDFQWTNTTAVKIAIDMGIFDLATSRAPEDLTVEDIASSAGADPVLVERIMRSLIISGLFSATPRNTYQAHPGAKALSSQGSMQHMVAFIHDITACVSQKLPEFLAKTHYRNPNSCTEGPFQYTFNTTDQFYTWLQKRPGFHASFNGMMKATERMDVRWTDIFPAAARFATFCGPQAAGVLRLVDVAGGTGHNIQDLVNTLPDLQAQFTLQDLPEVVAHWGVRGEAQVEVMAHDIFQPQPVPGAHVYILKRILHNWPDKECRRILGHLRDAMAPHSILLIHDRVFPDGAAGLAQSDVSVDLAMMMLCGSMERSEAQFRTLFASVGLKLVKVWRGQAASQSQDGVVEVVLAEE